MDFELSETEAMFRDAAERFLRPVDVTARRAIRAGSGGYDRRRWRELADIGLLAIVADESVGGLGGSLTDLAVIAETFGLNNAADPWLENGALPVRLLSAGGDEARLQKLLDGSELAAVAFAERGQRYSLSPQTLRATATTDGYALSGDKQFVLGAAIADCLLVTAEYDGNFALFCLGRETAGLQFREYRIADGSIAADLHFDDVAVPGAARIAIDETAFRRCASEAALLASAEMVGLGQRLLDETIAYVKERRQFGVPIGSFQVIQHGLVDAYTELEQMRSLLLGTLLGPRSPVDDWQRDVAGTKAFVTERADAIARLAVQYHGAMGITDECAVGHGMKRILLLGRLFGAAGDHLARYACVA